MDILVLTIIVVLIIRSIEDLIYLISFEDLSKKTNDINYFEIKNINYIINPEFSRKDDINEIKR